MANLPFIDAVYSVVTIGFVSNKTNPLKSLSWNLLGPANIVIIEGESRSLTGEFQGSPRPSQASSRCHHLHLTVGTWKHKEPHQETVAYSQCPTPLYPLTVSLLYILPFKAARKKTRSATTPWWMVITVWEILGNHGWDPLPNLQGELLGFCWLNNIFWAFNHVWPQFTRCSSILEPG